MGKNRHLWLIHAAVLLFGVAGIFAKLIELPPIVIVFGRVLFAAIFLYLLLKAGKKSLQLNRKADFFIFFLMGGLLAAHWFTFFKSIQMSSVAIGLLSYSTFPVITSMLEPRLMKESFKWRNLFLAFISLIGVSLILPGFNPEDIGFKAVLWGLLSGILFSFLSISNRKYVRKYPAMVIAFYQDAFAALILLPILFFVDFKCSPGDVFLLLLLGLVFTAIAHSLFIESMKKLSAHTAGVIASLEPVYGIIAAIPLIGEIPSYNEIAGGALIISASIYLSIRNKDR